MSLEEALQKATGATCDLLHRVAHEAVEFFKERGVMGPDDRGDLQHEIVLVVTILANLASSRDQNLRLLDLAARAVRARGPAVTEECNVNAINIRILHDLRYLTELLL